MSTGEQAGQISNSGNAFAAEMLERGASGFAGFAASVLLEKSPGIKQRYQPDPFGNWKTHITQRILELAAAVSTGESLMFTSRVMWSRKAFLARNQDETDLVISLSALHDVLAENLPAAASADALAYVNEAMDMLSGARPALEASELDPSRTHDRLALRYLQGVLEGNVAQAINELVESTREGMSATDV